MKLALAFTLLTSLALVSAGCSEDETRNVGSADSTTNTGNEDAGNSGTTDSGEAPSDSGVEPTDTGVAPVDAGQTPADSGSISMDATTPDSGSTLIDPGPRPAHLVGNLDNWCQGQPNNFSFFVTSFNAIWTLAGDQLDDLNGGLGGNFGGLAGADYICQTIAIATGNGHKRWRAFLSVTDDGNGNAVNAIERIGTGPWFDANGRMVASGIGGLASARPDGDPQSVEDLPDECGMPLTVLGNAHDIVTGSLQSGMLATTDRNFTCNDWTSNDPSVGANTGGGPGGQGVMCGHSYPRGGGRRGANWAGDHPLRGCSKGANFIQNGAGVGTCIGCSGGYGGLYCFVAE